MESYAGKYKEEYIRYLMGEKQWQDKFYTDPDTTYNGESCFYENMVTFFNSRNPGDSWCYEISESKAENVRYVIPPGIVVKDKKTY